MKTLILLFVVWTSLLSRGQQIADDSLIRYLSHTGNDTVSKSYWKLSPRVRTQQKNLDSAASFSIVLSQPEEFKSALSSQKIKAVIIYEYAPAHIIVVRTTLKEVLQKILPLQMVTSIDLADRTPVEELAINDFDLSINKVNLVHGSYPMINGKELTVSIKENKPDSSDIDLKGRFLSTLNSSGNISAHATIMATVIGGAGNSFYTARGVAWGCTLSSSTFNNLFPDNDNDYLKNNITVQNHSYGAGIENTYGMDAMAYDISTITHPALLHVFSAGNAGNQKPLAGQYLGINGFANLTGSFKMAKNILTVGSLNASGTVPPSSSKGPAHDGRIKPELVAYGPDGSSGAAAIVTGIALLLQQAYKEKNENRLPSSALLRAVLFNSSEDVGAKGIDFSSGYGNANAYRALNTILEGRYLNGSLGQGDTQTFQLFVPHNAKNLKLTLAWNDLPDTANASAALVNDLDVQLLHQASRQSWQPWVLNSFANADSLHLLPLRKRDSLNNAEQITLDDPLPGNYLITVRGHAVQRLQHFHIAYQWDTLHSFKWTFPAYPDNLFSGDSNRLQWETTFVEKGKLEYSIDGGDWIVIDTTMDLSKKKHSWVAPYTFSTGLLRMSVAGRTFLSDTFTISNPVTPGVGFDCTDSVLLYWNNAGHQNYMLYKLGNQYLEPVAEYNSNEAILYKSAHPSFHYTVAPLLSSGRIGVKSFTFNYTAQGVGCYVKNFLADRGNGITQLKVELGTTYLVKKMVVEKLTGGIYTSLQDIEPVNNLDYGLTDPLLTKGLNTYRLKIVLRNGNTIFSKPETVYNHVNSDYIVFPNPLQQGQMLSVLTKDAGHTSFQLHDLEGKKLTEKSLGNSMEQLPTSAYARGLYPYVIWKNGVIAESGILVIR